MTTYKTTYAKGMNTRPTPSVNNAPNGTVAYGQEVVILETFSFVSDGLNFKKNDLWARLEGTPEKWVAVVHLGKVYGELFNEEAPPPDPQPVASFPQSFIQTNNDPKHPDYGKQAEYVFVRVLP